MLKKLKNAKFLTNVPPWIFVGAVAVLFPIFAYMTIENINRQKENNARLLLEKGAALIRSFEVGTRTGLMGDHWSGKQLRLLLRETAQQNDIMYLMVVDENGLVLAHNDQKNIGKLYGRSLNLSNIAASSDLKWRLVEMPDGKKVFEVIRRFSPSRGRRAVMMFEELFSVFSGNNGAFTNSRYIIFIGLDMSTIEEAANSDIRHTIIMGTILLLVGFGGIILLFLAHNYRTTRTSLSRIKAFSDNLVENIPVGLVAVDNENCVASFNQVAGKILALTSDIILEKNAEEILPGEMWDMIVSSEIKKGIVEKEIDVPDINGKFIPMEVTATLLYDENRTFLGYVILFKDLTEVRALKESAERNQRLASIGSLAAGVAHEIRNPLSSIKGFATYFKERYEDISEDQHTADVMIQEVDRLNRVVGQLLEFSRPINVTGKSTDIREIINNSLLLVEKQAEVKNIKIRKNIPGNIGNVIIDPDRINQVFLNLFLNAIESMDYGGVLSINLLWNEVKNGIEINISDTGIGISEKDLSHIFDPYFTTKSSGTGIGLAIVHNIIEAHKGEIKVQSRENEGTSMILYLPS